MIRRTALLSALTLSLLLSACGKKNDDAAGEQAQAAAEVQNEDAPAEEAPAPPPPKADTWPVLGPLVAGTYNGACLRTPDGHKADATITVTADGKASAGGLDIDFREAKKLMVGRTREDKDQFRTLAIFTVDDDKGGLLSLQGGVGETSVNLSKGDVGLLCSNVNAEQLNAQPLYVAFAKLMNGKKQTVSCLDTKNLLVRRDVDVAIDDGVLKIGDASYDIKTAASESVSIDDAGRSVAFGLAMADKRSINLFYDGAGKLTSVMGMSDQGPTHSCKQKEG